jgi:anti-anti-sigma factor
MAEEGFVLDGARLTVTGDLRAGREDALRATCARLLDRPERELRVDLSGVGYIHSLSVGMLSYAWVEALSRDKEMLFVVSPQVAAVFEKTGLDKVFSFEISGA